MDSRLFDEGKIADVTPSFGMCWPGDVSSAS